MDCVGVSVKIVNIYLCQLAYVHRLGLYAQSIVYSIAYIELIVLLPKPLLCTLAKSQNCNLYLNNQIKA